MSDIPAPVTEPQAGPDEDALALKIGASAVRKSEGTCLTPYQDGAGNWTIGTGSVWIDGVPVTARTKPITADKAESLMMQELQHIAEQVDALLKVYSPACQRGALYSFAYNEGVDALRRSALLRLLNAGRVDAAADEFAAWVYAGGEIERGLVIRRAFERDVFLGKVLP